MSTRYVWEKFNVVKVKVDTSTPTLTYDTVISQNTAYCAVLATTMRYNAQQGYYELGGKVSWIASGGFPQNAAAYPYLAFLASDSTDKEPNAALVFYNSSQSASDETLYWTLKKGTVSGGAFAAALELVPQSHVNDSNSHLYHKTFTQYQVVEEDRKGEASQGKVSSYRRNAYPDGGAYNGFWHQYLGSDSIDPQAVSVELSPSGESATARVTPARALYGGTFSYQYQSRVNQEAWKNLSKTTAESLAFPLPAGAQTIQFRVQASDSWGFASDAYIHSPVTPVNRIDCYVRVNGAARKVQEIFINVNGYARKVTEAYGRVGNTAKKLF